VVVVVVGGWGSGRLVGGRAWVGRRTVAGGLMVAGGGICFARRRGKDFRVGKVFVMMVMAAVPGDVTLAKGPAAAVRA
jgi:hypothetical protein